MRSSLRNRLLALFLVLVVVVGAGTLYWIERTLADDRRQALAFFTDELFGVTQPWDAATLRQNDRGGYHGPK